MSSQSVSGTLLDEHTQLSLDEFSRACSSHSECIIELVREGVLEPSGDNPDDWIFIGTSVSRAHIAHRLERDLGLNLAGVALALDLLDEINALRARLHQPTT